MSKFETKSLLRVVKQMRKEGETWEAAAKHLNRNKIRTVRGLRWKSTNLQAWFSNHAS
jgi:hypothetical protein